MQKCWFFENSNTISDFTHDNTATTLSCSVALSDFNESNAWNTSTNRDFALVHTKPR